MGHAPGEEDPQPVHHRLEGGHQSLPVAGQGDHLPQDAGEQAPEKCAQGGEDQKQKGQRKDVPGQSQLPMEPPDQRGQGPCCKERQQKGGEKGEECGAEGGHGPAGQQHKQKPQAQPEPEPAPFGPGKLFHGRSSFGFLW